VAYRRGVTPGAVPRPVRTAVLLAVGTELTVGETRDTNSGDLARVLSGCGVRVLRTVAVPDDRLAVEQALSDAADSADLVVTTGGLGPTPDDLTREAIAAVLGEEPAVDPGLGAWLRELFDRRGVRMPDSNLKQAWLIPSASALPNPAGTAPGWWVERPDGGLIVALPGPPREMSTVWDVALPKLRERGLGSELWTRTLRLTGIGESAVVDRIGEARLRVADPIIATYARADSVDLRITARPDGSGTAAAAGEAVAADMEQLFAGHVFAHDEEGWVEALGTALAGRTLGLVEIGAGGRLTALLGPAPWLIFAEHLAPGSETARSHRDVGRFAQRVADAAGADVGLALRTRERRGDTVASIATALEGTISRETRLAFLGGIPGQHRAALAACAALWRRLSGASS
jgi:molybdenum cofactor synthesis domain-containing protein